MNRRSLLQIFGFAPIAATSATAMTNPISEFVVRYAGRHMIECSGVVPWINDTAIINGQKREIHRMACISDSVDPHTVFVTYLSFDQASVGDVVRFERNTGFVPGAF
jgi:hypothetical protein